MKIADLKEGMRIRALGPWGDKCWKEGDVFEVKVDIAPDGAHGPMPYVMCHAGNDGDVPHYLDAHDDGSGNLPEFEPE